ncbi:MAG: phage tail tape measure protein, partial [Candidatus Hodarchaeales archaeon]
MPNIDRMDIQIRAHDQATRVLDRIAGKFGVTTRHGLAMGAAFAGINLAVQALQRTVGSFIDYINESSEAYRDFSDAMAEVNTMLSEETERLLPDMSKAILDMSVRWGKSAVDLAHGMYQILSASVDATKGIRFLEVASKAATAGLTSVETAVDALTTVINAYGLQAEDAERISDIMFETIKRGKLRFEELAQNLGYVVNIAAEAGVGFEEVSAAFATMTKQGISADKAARSLRQLINSIVSPTEEAKNQAAEYGVVLDGLHFSVVGLTGFLNELNDALGMNKTAYSEIFDNIRALSAVYALTSQNVKLFTKDIVAMFENSAGASAKAAMKIIQSGGFTTRALEQATKKLEIEQGRINQKTANFWGKQIPTTIREGAMEIGKAFVGTFDILFHPFPSSEDKARIEKTWADVQQHMENIGKIWEVPKATKEQLQSLKQEYLNAVDAAKEHTNVVVANAEAVVNVAEALEVLNNAQNYASLSLEDFVDVMDEATTKYNENIDAANDAQAALSNLGKEIFDLESTEQLLQNAIEELNYQLGTEDAPGVFVKRLNNLKKAFAIEEDIYNADLALKQLGIEAVISDNRLNMLTQQLNQYSVELERMKDVQWQTNMVMKENSLEMLKLQLSAMQRRGRYTRDEKRRLEELRQANLKYRIESMENDIELQQFKHNYFDTAKKEYDDYVAVLNHRVKELKKAKDNEIEDLEHQLKRMLKLRETYLGDLDIIFKKEQKKYREYLEGLYAIRMEYERKGVLAPEKINVSISETEKKLGIERGLTYAEALTKYYAEHPGVMGPIAPSALIPYGYRGYQTGTPFVPETGLYMLHRGEAVIPAGRNKPSTVRIEVAPITITNYIRDITDV